jgi:hypothetical protein
MVNHVEINNVMEEESANPAKVAVNCGKSSFQEIPRILLIFRQGRVGMMKICDGD